MTAKAIYEDALARVLIHEGGKVDNPKDPGGRTNQGVTQRVYDGYRSRKGLSKRDVYDMEDAERDAIFKAQYWDAIKGDKLPVGVSYVVFDGAVNSGPKQSVKWLQRALGLPADGIIGEVTLAAVQNDTDNDQLIAAICDRRMAFLKALKTFKTFGKGWTTRVNSVERTGQAWASGSVAPPTKFVEGANAKANVEAAKQAPGKGLADTATGVGSGAGGTSLVLNQLQEQLTPYSAAGGWIERLVVALIVIGGILTLGGLAYRFYASRKKAELVDALDLQPVTK